MTRAKVSNGLLKQVGSLVSLCIPCLTLLVETLHDLFERESLITQHSLDDIFPDEVASGVASRDGFQDHPILLTQVECDLLHHIVVQSCFLDQLLNHLDELGDLVFALRLLSCCYGC
jgi:hypothetical protein